MTKDPLSPEATPNVPGTSFTTTGRSAGIVLLKLLAIAVAVYLAVFYLRLGYLLLLAWIAGVAAALYWTTAERSALKRRVIDALAVALVYSGIQLSVFALAETHSDEVFTMLWIQQPAHAELEPEIVLEFESHLGNYLGFYSSEIRDSLASTGANHVDVSFSVTRDIGCLRGFQTTRIGELTSWSKGSFAYSRAVGSAEPVWSDPWWCP